MRHQLEAFLEGVLPTCLPGPKAARQRQAGLGSFRTTRATADLPHHDQGAQTALRQVVVGAQLVDEYKLKQFVVRFTAATLR